MSAAEEFDVIVVGGGPGGYPTAIRAAQLGMRALCIDSWVNHDGTPSFGGTCLNAGCIPSKALLESSELYHRAATEFSRHGIGVGKLSLDLAAMQARRAEVSKANAGGVQLLFKANKVTGLFGRGTLLGGGKVGYTSNGGKTQATYSAKHIVIATGSAPVELRKIAPFDGERVVDSWGALEFSAVPKRLGIIGAGVIGVELGSVWSRLGAEVVILEALPGFLPMVDAQISKEALRTLTKQGLDIRLGAKVVGVKATKKNVEVTFERDGKAEKESFDKLIVAVGRRPYTENLGCEVAGVELTERGFVKIDANYRTSAAGIYAVGDVTGGAMLAHKAIEEGVALAEQLAGQKSEVNYRAVPSVIYTAPEIAWVGLSEEQAKQEGHDIKVGTSSFVANGRARAMEQAAGTIKFISDAKTDRILGVHMIGPYVSELLAEAVLALEFGAVTEDIQLTMHAHPSLAETFHEAALAVDGHAIHSANKARKA
ncbi:MAG: dihydrolipoyl dehydrogenase [Nevskiaceae bacterium]|nr:MAG: dihydrolipoyl dehydrogenase [Nevskiaceae bacterium]TBR74084.1 MAG: dihydrolipoyl dehydrogenase [Nevskiaceae bacterium]